VTKVGNTENLPRLQRVISITFPEWAFLHAELALESYTNECTHMLRRYARISSLSASRVSSSNSVQIGCRSSVNSQISEFCPSYFRTIIRTNKTYVGCKYTNFITSSGIFQAFFVSVRLYVKCINTSCFGCSKWSL